MKELGKEFELDFFRATKINNVEGVVNMTGTEKDLKKGTDLEYFGIPMDLTLGFFTKNNTEVVGTMPLCAYTDIQFGVRTDNGYQGKKEEFTPVIVIGFTAPFSMIAAYYDVIMESFEANIGNILDEASNQYWNWMDREEVNV